MKRATLLAAATLAAGACLVSTLDLSGFACDANHPCLGGWVCADGGAGLGSCVLANGNSGGGSNGGTTGGGSGGGCSQSPQCSGDGSTVLLCDGGVQRCGVGTTCFQATCLPNCLPDGGCGSGICDAVTSACVPLASCSGVGTPCGQGGVCLAQVCTSTPPVGPSPGSCPGFADGGPVTLGGALAFFPNGNALASLIGGTVTFFGADGQQVSTTIGADAIPDAGEIPVYSTAGISPPLSPGIWTVLVQQAGVALPTYFPNVLISAGTSRFDLVAVVPADLGQLLPQHSAEPGHLIVTARAVTCNQGGYLQGYTIGLSPPPAFAGYYNGSPGSGLFVDPSLSASTTSGAGEFIASDAPYAPTQYVLAVDYTSTPQALLSGTFTPPPYHAGQTIAVALLYPNVTR